MEVIGDLHKSNFNGVVEMKTSLEGVQEMMQIQTTIFGKNKCRQLSQCFALSGSRDMGL